MMGETHTLTKCSSPLSTPFRIIPATSKQRINTLATVHFETVVFLITRKYNKGAVKRISARMAFERIVCLVTKTADCEMRKHAKNTNNGNPRARFQLTRPGKLLEASIFI
jgi:hypothetical protein